jgi:hypothetical protein
VSLQYRSIHKIRAVENGIRNKVVIEKSGQVICGYSCRDAVEPIQRSCCIREEECSVWRKSGIVGEIDDTLSVYREELPRISATLLYQLCAETLRH